MDTLDGMRAFATVVDAGSFSAAAQRLGLSKALVSKYVGQLEQRLGARLINRTTRSLQPTEIGRSYYARCVQILEEIDDLEEAVLDQHRTVRGHLRIAGPRVFGEDQLVPCVADFMAHNPAVTIDLALEERWVDLVAEGFDLAVRIGALADSSLVARRICSYKYVLCAAPAYLARAGTPANPADLVHHDTLVNSVVSPSSQWEFVVDGGRVAVTVVPKARVNSGHGSRVMTLAGHGIGFCLLPTVAEDLQAGRLVRILETYEAYDRTIYAVYPHAKLIPGKLRAFIDHLVAWSAIMPDDST